MSKKITESIFNGARTVIPMADVQHIERHWYTVAESKRTKTNYDGLRIITKHTTWDRVLDDYANSIYLGGKEAEQFLRAWCRYRSEVDGITPNS